jgi:quercetin dioxygenase-like cupin family protein
MSAIFPTPITELPEADIPLEGIKAYLSQSDTHQILFMEFEKDVDLPEHSHAAQVGIVLEGTIDLTIDGKGQSYTKGDRYYIPEGAVHSGKIHAGYADITFFNEPTRYLRKKGPEGDRD